MRMDHQREIIRLAPEGLEPSRPLGLLVLSQARMPFRHRAFSMLPIFPIRGRCREPSGTKMSKSGSARRTYLVGAASRAALQVRLGSPDLLGRCREPTGTRMSKSGSARRTYRIRSQYETRDVFSHGFT